MPLILYQDIDIVSDSFDNMYTGELENQRIRESENVYFNIQPTNTIKLQKNQYLVVHYVLY